jgi:regulator of replication initiation timing
MKNARYHKKCFDQIEGIAADNKELTAEVDRLRQRLEAANHEKMVQVSHNQNLVTQLSNKERERTSK